jgi:hypothetical protein
VKYPRTVRSLVIAGTLGALALQSIIPAAATASEEACYLAAINAARAATGVRPLGTNDGLLGIARSWSRTMANAGHIFHDTNLPNVAPSEWLDLGENVGVGPTCGAVAQAFMNSPEHRVNVLDPAFTTVGVGVVDAAGGVMYVTEDFMGTGATSGPLPAAAAAGHPAPVVHAPASAAPAPATVPVTPAPVLVVAPVPTVTSVPTPIPVQDGLLGSVVTALETFFSSAT